MKRWTLILLLQKHLYEPLAPPWSPSKYLHHVKCQQGFKQWEQVNTSAEIVCSEIAGEVGSEIASARHVVSGYL